MQTTTGRVPNRLISEKSPYLLQHAHNPVDWYPWSEEAFEKAKSEDKPVFLSIGYSTCHWCHVMAHECFEDEEVSKLMNETFINIKVDREERPDIDGVYMTVCQMMTGSGGWPLTIIMTPDKKPFYTATYIPKHGRYSRIGMMELVPKINELWNKNHEEILKSAEKISSSLLETEVKEYGEMLDAEVISKAYEQFQRNFDKSNGGFGNAPKFPTPHNLMFLLRYWRRTGEKNALDMVTGTLDAMSMGGIFDHIGFGFHRYSTDSKWFLPHFEKMLYDQALLLMAYTECYQATKYERYKLTAEKIIKYIIRDLLSDEGAFYSAEDADSEGEEGKFYVWSVNEFEEILGPEDSKIAEKIYNISMKGNFQDEASGKRTGNNILYLKKPLEDIIRDCEGKITIEKVESIRNRLFENREKRERPHRDDKVLTDWNGLTIGALSKAAAAFDNVEFLNAAKKAADFVLSSIDENKALMHRYRKGEWNVPGNVDDYSFFIMGLIELYEAGFEVKYLRKAFELNEVLINKFWDKDNGGLFFTSNESEKLLIRSKEIYDGAVPSGNSAALLNFLRLSRIAGTTELEDKAKKMIRTFSNDVNNVPYAHAYFLTGFDLFINQTFEIVIAGDFKKDDTMNMIREINSRFIPEKVLLVNPSEAKDQEIYKLSNYIENQNMVDEKATAYVCKNYSCNRPVTDVDAMVNLLI